MQWSSHNPKDANFPYQETQYSIFSIWKCMSCLDGYRSAGRTGEKRWWGGDHGLTGPPHSVSPPLLLFPSILMCVCACIRRKAGDEKRMGNKAKQGKLASVREI